MSWDVLILNVPPEVSSVEELPDDFTSRLGSHEDVLKKIADAFPEIDLSDPTWGLLDGPDYSIEFNIGEKDPIDAIMLHVRGSDQALSAIETVCNVAEGWTAMDVGNGEFIDFSIGSATGFRNWRNFRDKAIGNGGKSV
jgi:hypothetical protein